MSNRTPQSIQMSELLSIITKLQNESSKAGMQAIIENNLDNSTFVATMQFLLNPFIVTGLSMKKINKTAYTGGNEDIQSIEALMNYLTYNNTGRDYDIATCYKFMLKLDEYNLKDLVIKISTKSLKVGIDSLWNKTVPSEYRVPEFDVMLAKNFDDYSHKVNGKFTITKKLDGCFTGATQVLMADGTQKKIKDITIGDMVLSFDEYTKNISPKMVTNTFFNGEKNSNEWIDIKLFSGKHLKKITVTKNHKIFTNKGWIKAGNLNENDKIFYYRYMPSYEQIQFVIGSVLGDTNIVKDSDSSLYGRLQTRRTTKFPHDIYFEKQCDLFRDFKLSKFQVKSGYGSDMYVVNVTNAKFLSGDFIKDENINKTSYRVNNWSMSLMDEMALAIFYMDDGTKRSSQEDGYKVSNKFARASFSMYRQDYDELVLFQKILFDKFGIRCEIKRDKKLKNGQKSYRIDINKEASKIFFDKIAKYIPKEMRYKLPESYVDFEEYDWWNKLGKYELIEHKIASIEPYNGKRKAMGAYDIEVEDNHTYFANGIAVHNCRLIVIKENGQSKAFTRTGKKYEGLEDILDIFNIMVSEDNMVWDGELLANVQGDNQEVFSETQSLARSKGKNKKGLVFHCFDMLPLKEFKQGESKLNAIVRKQRLHEWFESYFEGYEPNSLIQEVEVLYSGDDQSMIEYWANYATSQGWEGLILNLDMPYVTKRTDALLKIKKFKTCDVFCIDFEQGGGKLSQTLGSIVIKYKGNIVNVGSGFSQEQRDEIWRNRDKYIGQLCEVQYFEESKDKSGNISLRFPTFVRFRFDKTEESYN